MSMQMYIIAQHGKVVQETSREVQRCVREQGGLILMVTRTGPLVLLDDSKVPQVQKHPLVRFMGPVTLNPRGVAANRLQQIFVKNLSKQLIIQPAGGAEPQG
jgi:hypothetical protein